MIKIEYKNIFDVNIASIVNPANISLLSGSGLCGAIHKKAGKELEEYCKKLNKCKFGDVRITPSFKLDNCSFIIHACGPRWIGGKRGEEDILKTTYQNIFAACLKEKIFSVAIPAISTGIYGFPIREATDIAITEALKYNDDLNIIFINSEKDKHEIYQEIFLLKSS